MVEPPSMPAVARDWRRPGRGAQGEWGLRRDQPGEREGRGGWRQAEALTIMPFSQIRCTRGALCASSFIAVLIASLPEPTRW